jgi:hypothetical protein
MGTKKKVKLGPLDADPDQFVLIVNYTTEIQQLDDTGRPVAVESTPGQKTIRIPRGLQPPDIPQLAHEVIESCKYIQSSKIGEVERLLQALMEYEQGVSPAARPPMPPERGPPAHNVPQNNGSKSTASRRDKGQDPLLPQADVRCIEDYADQLYEDRMELKVHGAKCILSVCTEPGNLEILADHGTLLGVLSRELRECSKKSFELSIAVVCTFLCFSHFSQFHRLLMQHQCGHVTMSVVEYESQRNQVRKEDLERRVSQVEQLGDKATQEDRRLLAKDEKKYNLQLNRQSKLMHVCLVLLLNLAEDPAIEKKMVNRKMPLLLAQLLDRTHEDLVVYTLQFLKKLSCFEENKDQISSPETMSHLVRLSQHPNVRIALLALRVLYNVSFDEGVRDALTESGIVKMLVDHLRNPPFRHIVLRLLYHFSMDDRCKSLMAYQRDGMVMLLQLVVHFPENRVGKDLVALVVNLATHPGAAEAMVRSGLFPQVLLRVLKTRDPLLCKVIRHVASHKNAGELMCELLQSDSVRMSKWMNEFVRMANMCINQPDLLVEVLGTLANVQIPDTPWEELCEAGLVELLTRLLVIGFSEDDIVLECVMLVGNLALNQVAAGHVAGSRLPAMLQDLLVEKRDDDEIVTQLLYAFQCLLLWDELRDVILQDTQLGPCVMRFARSKNSGVLDQAMRLLQMVAEYAGDLQDGASWVEQMKAFRFEESNKEWCTMVQKETMGGTVSSGPGGYYDDRAESGDEEDEEEFAFHWACGDVGDAQDLANRDWGNKVEADFLRSSRFVS